MKKTKIRTRNICFQYHKKQILKNISVEFPKGEISAIAGPSGSGKSSFLIVLNRLWEEIDGVNVTGKVEIELNGQMQDIYSGRIDIRQLRRKVSIVFQQPNPLPMSIFKNVAFPLNLAGLKDRERISREVESALKKVHLWDEVKDRLKEDGRLLSGGQQQRLCLARTLVMRPEVLLLDEPTASLDARTAEAIEQLLIQLKSRCTIVMVTHYQDQIQRIADSHFEVVNGNLINR